MDLTTPGYKELRWEFNLTFDGGDSWGSTLDWWFAVAENLYHAGGDVPAEWQFRAAPGNDGVDLGNYSDATIKGYLDLGTVTTDDLVAFGTVLTRYANLLKMAGKDY
jgi:hypothetical protein